MKSAKFYLWTILYKVIFEVVYILYVSPVYSHMGAKYEPNFFYLFISYLMFFILIIIEPLDRERPSHQLAQLLFLTTMVPLLSIFWLSSQSYEYILFTFLCFIGLFLLLRIKRIIKIPLLKRETNLTPKVTSIAFIVSFVILGVFIIKFGGIDARTFSFETVYDLRKEAEYSGIWIYLINLIGKNLIPLCIIIFLLDNKKIPFILSCFMQVIIYLSTGHKTFILAILLLLSLSYILSKGKWKVGLPRIYALMIIGAAFLYELTDKVMIIAIVPLRLLIIPTLISFGYYDFFSVNQKLFFSEGLIGKILGLQSPYPISSKYLVSLSTYEGSANTGFLSDAYSNGGIMVMLLFVMLFTCILLFIDSISLHSNKKLKYTALMIYQIINLNDGALLTSLLTGGLGALLLFMYVYASEEKNLELKLRQ